jgi:hypothetical protein
LVPTGKTASIARLKTLPSGRLQKRLIRSQQKQGNSNIKVKIIRAKKEINQSSVYDPLILLHLQRFIKTAAGAAKIVITIEDLIR